MNPQGYPSASVPLQGVPYGQPEENDVEEPPKDHIIWSIFNFAYVNPCCLGLGALTHSIRARDRKMVGDLEGARRHGSTARWLNIASTVLICLPILICIIVFIAIRLSHNK